MNAVDRYNRIFTSGEKTLIAMVHLPALPGTPLYDASAGVGGIVAHVARDLDILVSAGFDAVMFCNENDRPYQLRAGLESAAVMSRVISDCLPIDMPFGVDYLWDPRCALAVAVATDAAFIREVASGVWESDMGLWQPDAAALLRERRRLDADDVGIFMNITPEFASSIGSRDIAAIAASTTVSSLPDAILVSGPMAGAEPSVAVVELVRAAVPAATPVLLNTGAKSSTIARYLEHADGCIVGSDLKVDGHTWNPVDKDRALRFVDAARRG